MARGLHRQSKVKLAFTLSLTLIQFLLSLAARNLLLRPLSAAQVRDLLQRHQLEHRVPEGRSVSNGFAALTGYTLGLTKALTGVFIYDIITANVTDSESSAGTAQQVCFNTRSLDEVERKGRRGRRLDYSIYNRYKSLGRQTTTDAETEEAEAAIDEDIDEAIEADIDAGLATATATDAAIDATTDTDTDTDSDTNIDTDTDTPSTTTSDEYGQTCLILHGNR